ncbi:orange carotenoid protein N-terminal domain-containing protein [Leptolyngbya sp. FACHB-261]|uniref:orange carotenoid protein N-terminal domain-containing protein n=1 Tax=Leptolyngbya sp. FACHB-261 TaxID=2692806 RepID=UPI0016894509|nr:orange carotenoid protein N-terminal domain-containing protein [Leptolyngbya sp. FACHB-261]MBD2103343.1 orange carotenoid protein [Leptolyngbya sp. FACHB-261]
MSPDELKSQSLSSETQNTVEAFGKLDTDAKLAWLYLVYKKMGDSITPAAPEAAEPNLAPTLFENYFVLPQDQQLAAMRAIVNREDTDLSRAYGALKENNQLLVWYAWAVEMGNTVVDMPGNYQPAQALNDLLSQLEGLDFEQQISVLREIARTMGHTDVQPIPSQAETGKTASL